MLSDKADAVTKKVRGMFTDPNRIRADIPGRVEGNPVFQYHDAFNPDTAQVDEFKARYREGKIGDVEVKVALAAAINEFLDPIREKRTYYEQNMNLVEEALMAGVARMRVIAQKRWRWSVTQCAFPAIRRTGNKTGRTAI